MAAQQSAYGAASDITSRQRDISVSEFFLMYRQLLGYDSPSKALSITIKEVERN